MCAAPLAHALTRSRAHSLTPRTLRPRRLTRSTQIGEFYVMCAAPARPTPDGPAASTPSASARARRMPPQIKPTGDDHRHCCDLLIYDEESDKHVRIGWREAMKACCLANIAEETVIAGPKGADEMRVYPQTGRGNITKDWKSAATAIADYNDGDSDDWSTVNTNIRIVLARPFIEHLMHSAILCVAGRDTGATRTIRPLEPRTRHALSLAARTRCLARAQCSARRTCSCRRTRR